MILRHAEDQTLRGLQEQQKKEGNQNQKVYQLERRPRGRPRIYREGTIGRPEDIDYFLKIHINVIKPKRDALRLTPLLKHHEK